MQQPASVVEIAGGLGQMRFEIVRVSTMKEWFVAEPVDDAEALVAGLGFVGGLVQFAGQAHGSNNS
jgi:hypothetical protein